VKHDSLSFNSDFLTRYLQLAPAALAAERTMECDMLSARVFARPVLDIGCGDGIFAHVLFAEKVDTGIDPDPAEIEIARTLDAYRELVVCSGSSIPKPDGSYRTVFSNSVLEHIPDLEPVLREVHRLMAPGGSFFVTIPTDRWERTVLPSRILEGLGLTTMAQRYGRFYNSFWKHYRALPVRDWKTLFESVGFNVEEVKTYSSANMTTMLDILTPFAGPAMVSKKLLRRWIPLRSLRAVTVPVIQPAIKALMARFAREQTGGLVFFALTK
jgi:ubiquinone/menaquinone biosynthesis C-methylase UbiE